MAKVIEIRTESVICNIPLHQALYCENCNTISNSRPYRCGVCGSEAVLRVEPKGAVRDLLVGSDRCDSGADGVKHSAEQVVNLLRQIDVAVANGKTTPQACKEAGIVEQTYFRWRKEYGGLRVDQARRLKEVEQENAKLKRLVAELSLDKLVLKDIASGNF
jgi:putative transposase